MSRYLSGRFRSLSPYTPGEQPRDQQYIKLNTNESPFPPSPFVTAAVSGAAVSRLNLYSDPTARLLEGAIAEYYGLDIDQVIAGNGSDEILAFCFQAYCDQKTGPCYPDITYGFYQALTQLYSLYAHILPLDTSFRVVPEDYFGIGRTIFLANPNAPTGVYLPLDRVEEIVRSNPGTVVVVDEAYIDFGGESAVSLINSYDNLVVVMTFSKSRSLAGGRLGFALAQASLIADLRKMKFAYNPYNVGTLPQMAGAAAMRDEAYFKTCTDAICQTRAWTTERLRERGFTVTDSLANFVFAKHPAIGGRAYYESLREKGVLVRHFPSARTADWVRITIGTEQQMRALLSATDTILEDAK